MPNQIVQSAPSEGSEVHALSPDSAHKSADKLQKLAQNIALILRGQDDAIDMAILALVAGGHLLIQDVPGVGKTTLAIAFAQSLDIPNRRIQFTADILPSDIVGLKIYDPKTQSFSFHPGPIFTNLLLADEINRAEPRAQSALLEAMFEQQVSVDGETRPLPSPFMVIATQNPVDFSGTFPLPDSQLDRFLFCLSLGYPSREAEREILSRTIQNPKLQPVLDSSELLDICRQVDLVQAAPSIIDQTLAIIHATRLHPLVTQGASTRAMIDLLRAAKARAILHRRHFVLPEDLQKLAIPTLAHRIRKTSNARVQNSDILADILEKIEIN